MAKGAKKRSVAHRNDAMNDPAEREIWLERVLSVMRALGTDGELTVVQRRRLIGQLSGVAIGLKTEVEAARKRRPNLPALNLAAVRLHVLTSEPHRAYVEDAAEVIANSARPALSEGSIKTRRNELRRSGRIDTELAMWMKLASWDHDIKKLVAKLRKTRRVKVRKYRR